MKVKICGITNVKDAEAAVEAGADALGFVFAKSPRKVTLARARAIIDELPPFVKSCAVFVNEKSSVIDKVIRNCRIDILQFHGDEPPAYCAKFREKKKVVKAFRVKDESALKEMAKFKNSADAFLLDAFVEGKRGGTGEHFNWNLAIKAKRFGKPIILSGGLDPKNVKRAISKVSPYAVDTSSGVETCPGKKDHRLVKKFILNARQPDSF